MSRMWLPGDFIGVPDAQRWENGLGGGGGGSSGSGATPGLPSSTTIDATVALQAFINANAGVQRVIIPANVTYAHTGLTLPSNTTLILDGTLLLLPASNKSSLYIVAAAQNVRIAGSGTIDGNRTAQTGGFSEGIGATTGGNFVVRDITIKNCLNMPVNFVGSKGVLVQNVTMQNSGNSCEFAAGAEDCWAVGNRISGINDFGFAIYGRCHKCGVVGNNITTSVSTAITVLTDAAQGGGSTDCVIANNILHDNIQGAISIVSNGGGPGIHSGLIVEGNRGFNNWTGANPNYSGAGVSLTNGYNVLIQGNSFGPDGATGNTTGIYVQGNAGRVSNAVIQNNFIYDQGTGGSGDGIGIFTDGTDVNTIIRGNSITDTLLKASVDGSGNVTYAARVAIMGTGLRGVAGPGCTIESNLIRNTVAASSMDVTTNSAVMRSSKLGWVLDANSSVLGNLAVNGTVTSNGGGFVASQPNSSLEIGSNTVAGAAFVDLHSSGSVRDYDSRMISTGGSTTANGAGTLAFLAALVNIYATVGLPNLQAAASFANDAAAATGGVLIGQLYRNGSLVQLRVT